MTKAALACSPRSHPHADQPNWQPAADIGEYLANCREGIEAFSERRAAKLLGLPRIHVWRMRQMAHIPDALFERLLGCGTSSRELATIGASIEARDIGRETQCCPNCGHVLRHRTGISQQAIRIIMQWLDEVQQ